MPALHVLVEGESDAGAVYALAGLLELDLAAIGVAVRSAAGVTNFPRLLEEFAAAQPETAVCGMYDAAEERHVRRALVRAGRPIRNDEPTDAFGFFACVADLEDELIRALGTPVVEGVLESQRELGSFRRFQAMPQHRGEAVHAQLRRFLGTRATRKVRSARLLAGLLSPAKLPRPLEQLAARLRQAADSACGSGDT